VGSLASSVKAALGQDNSARSRRGALIDGSNASGSASPHPLAEPTFRDQGYPTLGDRYVSQRGHVVTVEANAVSRLLVSHAEGGFSWMPYALFYELYTRDDERQAA